MLLHLLIHANQHSFEYLSLLQDIRWQLAAEADSIDSELLFRSIANLRMETSAYFGLLLAREMAGAAVPESWLEHLRPRDGVAKWFRRKWELDDVLSLARRKRSHQLEAPIFYLLQMGRMRDKLKYLGRVLAMNAISR